mmetsp:Transcript_56766/g.135225  ORF Transcript_56766/g.135225 Transcript_56766/m.135225 type:complete len:235 (-) Transcript_56766:731-1435(-)
MGMGEATATWTRASLKRIHPPFQRSGGLVDLPSNCNGATSLLRRRTMRMRMTGMMSGKRMSRREQTWCRSPSNRWRGRASATGRSQRRRAGRAENGSTPMRAIGGSPAGARSGQMKNGRSGRSESGVAGGVGRIGMMKMMMTFALIGGKATAGEEQIASTNIVSPRTSRMKTARRANDGCKTRMEKERASAGNEEVEDRREQQLEEAGIQLTKMRRRSLATLGKNLERAAVLSC